MKENSTEQFEDYLNGTMSPVEKAAFEARLQSNPELHALLNLYSTIDAEMQNTEKYRSHEADLRTTLQKLNAVYFRPEAPVIKMSGNRSNYRFAMYAAAGLALILVSWFMVFQTGANSRQMANRYVKDELTHLSITMDGARDSLQQGIAAYNDKDYAKALPLFETIYSNHPENSDALKYAGITCLVTKEYNKALQYFDELAGKKELFSNPGRFLKAVTLLQRNLPGDKEQAEQLLQTVVNEKGEGSKEAALWLQK